ncbi:hypothetical protein PHYPSEUDO_015125 [Phytophthora pseudosyringae]|uniref:Uncharacterized protein n=1 Tax=Phytophthora pseudosyringae TaxID=221518 RepID=A0A8T1V3J4_9STRA|nr:hypothetical protein PHYPSEUDO_015125 [Phytophthora pseudosyringae]
MATVRTTPPRSAEPGGSKRKRKRMHKSKAAAPAAASAVDAQLLTLEKWHTALTADVRELRREGARVRLELEKVDDTAEAAVERAERCAAQAQAATTAKDELEKRFARVDRTLAQCRQSSINEEFLMTQLTQLQEQYENELSKVREDHEAVLDAQQKQLGKLERALGRMQEDRKREKQLEAVERTLQALREENSRLSQKLAQMATRHEVLALHTQVETLERENQDEQGRTRVDLNTFEDKLLDMERRVADTDSKVLDVDRKVDDVGAKAAVEPLAAPALLPPPLLLPRDLVRQADLIRIHDELRRVNRAFQAVGVDISALAKRTDARSSQQEQHVESRLQEMSTQVFDALGHDSRLHATEISRLKDAVFDVQSDHREFGQRMRRLEDDVQQAAAAARAQPRSPRGGGGGGPGWRYGQHQPEVLPTPPPSAASNYRNRREKPSRYEPAPDFRGNAAPVFENPPQGQIRWAPRRRSHSRSRSPPRRQSWGATGNGSAHNDSGPGQHGRRFERDDQQRNPGRSTAAGDLAVARNNITELTDSPPIPAGSAQNTQRDNTSGAAESNREGQAGQPFRRSRQPRRAPEVIVIEDDDDDDDDDDDEEEEEVDANTEDNAEEREVEDGEAVGTEPNRAPPDVVLDEEKAAQLPDVVMLEPPDTSAVNTGHVETTDLLEKDADLQTGFLLYFCLGGAPDLDVQWANCFTQLNDNECVEMPRVLRFQRRYGFLQSFPVYLTQCILQAVILNGQNGPESSGTGASRPTGALNAANVRAKFHDAVNDIHLSWAKALNEHLSKQASGNEELASEKLELSVNPAGLSSTADKDAVIHEWGRRQEFVMWTLAQKLHYGSSLPAMECNVDASPAVYLFTLMFDVHTVTSARPQLGTFRLNAFGGKALAYLWDYTLKKLPYVFFADWSWLEDQSTKEKLPALAFCHLLASILLWNSVIDHHSLTNRNIYVAAVSHMLPKLFVGGQAVHESVDAVDSVSLLLGECESTHIELHDLDSKFASMLGLDGFFEVTEAIQDNRPAAAGEAEAEAEAEAANDPASST